MKIKHHYDFLIIGTLSSWAAGFLVSIWQAILLNDVSAIVWFLMFADVMMLMLWFEINKYSDEKKLVWVEPFFLIVNLVTVMLAVGGFWVTFNEYWLAKEIRYISLALGLPSLAALIYWRIRKGNNTIL